LLFGFAFGDAWCGRSENAQGLPALPNYLAIMASAGLSLTAALAREQKVI
jgi:hypothetical protein